MPVEISQALVASEAVRCFSRGHELLSRRIVRKAIEYFDSAQRRGYDAIECAAARWQCWMQLGHFERAWQESDFITSTGAEDTNRFWDGRPWEGQRVMLRCLHGLGDTLQFIRYAPLLKKTCRSLTVQTHPQLMRLIGSVPTIDRVCTWGSAHVENRSTWDMQMEITELPRAFRTTLATIPATTPYVHVPKERIDWAERFFEKSPKIRVGLCWECGPWDPARSISLTQLAPLLSCANCSFYSLQKDADVRDGGMPVRIVDLESNSIDILDTAAFVCNLDLIVAVDTMTAHLAGALGRLVWILLPARADWRWMLERSDTPWYPNARLFRQRKPGDWSGVIEEVRTQLDALSASGNCPAS
jgi:hypothetical protein